MTREGNLVTAIRKEEMNTSKLDVFTGQFSTGNSLIAVSSGLVQNMPIVIDPSGKVTDGSKCYSVHDAINGAGSLDEVAQRLVDIEIMQERELRISGGLAYRQVNKDRSVVVIGFN